MLTSQRSLSLSGGRLVNEYMPSSYSPSGQFIWEEDVDEINTPDIDPSFFTDDPFKKMNNNLIDYVEDNLVIDNQTCPTDDASQPLTQQPLEDHVFIDLSQLINQSTESITNQSMVSPNEVLDNSYIPSTTAPVLHYMQPNKVIESMVSSVSIPVITTNDISSEPTLESMPLSQQPLTSSSHRSQSASPPMTTSLSYATPSSPALSYTSTASHSYYISSEEAMNTDSIDSMIETKPELAYLQPTVINDHLYTIPSTSSRSKRKSSNDGLKADKYLTTRKKNNAASKKSRITKKDKQKQMEEKIAFYIEDNQKCSELIVRMEKEIQWCKDYLFKKVVAASKS